jgi:cyclopropane-fatty-acyl-phospholipid synthase
MHIFFKRNRPVIADILLTTLSGIKYGELRLTTPDKEVITFKGKESGPAADITINDWKMAKRALTHGDVGFAEDYIERNWETSNLPALLTMCTMNITELDHFFHGKWFTRLVFALRNFLRSNTKKGSKKNIRAHYDLGNDFYQLWLDKTMTYSSAYYGGEENLPLEKAQEKKYQAILDKLAGKKGEHILEIGCGWGGFAEHAAKQGYRVTGLTLSKQQTEFARDRMKKAGLSDLVEIKILDYRDAEGKYDHIVSIEMFEAVGEKYWPFYFEAISRLLKKGGRAVIQTITIDDNIFEDYRKRSDFIQQYTFPGGALPSKERFIAEVKKAGLNFKSAIAFGQDYVTTLKKWLEKVEERIAEIRNLGYDEEFLRSWRFYLSYCIAGFTTKRTDVMQAELENV